jgi:ABC-type polysaccharide/polyol phosphate export permease
MLWRIRLADAKVLGRRGKRRSARSRFLDDSGSRFYKAASLAGLVLQACHVNRWVDGALARVCSPQDGGRMSLVPTRRDWTLASRDLRGGITAWNIWYLLGISDIRQRYNRSKFGQFWITLSMGIFIGGIGLVYSVLFNQPVHEYVPYLAVNVIIWTLISGTIGESGSVFTQATLYMRQDAMPKTIFVMRLLLRNIVVLAHNIVILPLTFLVFQFVPSAKMFVALPGLAILLVALFLITLLLGVLSTRFRDLPQIVQNALQLLFFVTPIMWRADQMSAGRQEIVFLNPFAALLRIVVEPILGGIPPAQSYLMAFIFIGVLTMIALPLFARFRARIVYWL